MKLLLRCLVLMFPAVVFSSLPAIGQETTSSDSASDVELRPIFSDDFSSDSLSDYQVKGNVVWEKGRLRLAERGWINLPFEAGSWLEVTGRLEFPKLKNDGDSSTTMLRIDLVGVTGCFVAWQQTREKGMTAGKVLILDTVSKDGKTNLKVVRSVSVSEPLESGEWSVEFRHGLLQVRRQKHKVLSGYMKNGFAVCRGLGWIQSVGHGVLSDLAIRGTSRRTPLSEEQKKKEADARLMDSLARQQYRRRKFALATRLGETALGIRRQVLGVEHPDYATNLYELALLYESQGDAAKAESLYLEALDIQKRVLGSEHPDYATSLNDLALLYEPQGNLVKAETLYVEALDIRKRVLGVEHPDYATSLNNMAGLYSTQEDAAKAEPLYLEALDITKRVLGVDHPSYATSLNNLALLYKSQGEVAKAEPLYLEALDIRKRVLGVEHSDHAQSLNNLAGLYLSQGDAAKAGPLLLEARDIYKRLPVVDHPEYAVSLSNLARLFQSQGEYAKTEPLFLEALDIQKRVLGGDHPNYARSLTQLARLYRYQRDAGKARSLYLEARDIYKRVLGGDHPDYAMSLNDLAGLYADRGDAAQAEPLYLEALDILKRVLGANHPNYARSLNDLALLYQSQGNTEKAEPLHLEALDITKRVLGVDHPAYASSLANLAVLYSSQGDVAKAEPLYLEALSSSRSLIDRNAIGQSQTTQLKYATTFRSRLDGLLSHGLESSTAGTHLSDEILSWKGMTLVRQRQYRLAREDSQTRPILEALTAVSRQLSALLRQTPTPKTQKMWRQQISEVSEKRDSLETQLAASSEEYRPVSERLTTDDLLQILPENTVLVDFLSFNFWQRVPKDNHHVLKSRRHVLASILRMGQPVEFVNLGPESSINSAIDSWRTVFLSKDREDADKVEPAGRALRKLVWEPLLPHLKDAKTVILCPDRALGRVAFAALPGQKKGTYLIEDYRLASISVPQLLPDLFREASERQGAVNDALLIGDVDYERSVLADAETPSRLRGSAELFQNVAFAPLAETAGEVAGIRDLFVELHQTDSDSVRLLQKQQATESAFRKYAGRYSTLHRA